MQELLARVLKRIGNYNGNMEPFTQRLLLQKTVYLAQAFGLNLGYSFSWYIHGPYSTQLTRDGYEMIATFNKTNVTELDHNNEAYLAKLVEFLGSKKNDHAWLEVTASIHVLKRIHSELTKEQIITMVMHKQPQCFSKEMCEAAWLHLEQYGLI